MITEDDRFFMRSAIAMARRGLGMTAPNPSVGCVLVKNGVIIARAHTGIGGRPHAEALALESVGEQACGATAYVTLEPCAHYGQTPPCAKALVKAGVSRVVIGSTDPDPRVSGKGIGILQSAGISVSSEVLREECDVLNVGFFHSITLKRPFVTLKTACSLDGFTATARGQSKWITGVDARAHAHMIRAMHDAVLVGVDTVIADNPNLTVRYLAQKRVITRVILDSQLRIPLDCDLVEKSVDEPVWIFFDPALADHEKIRLLSGRSHIKLFSISPKKLVSVLDALAQEGITRLLVEGGAAVHGSFLRASLCDHLYVYKAPIVIGGAGKSLFPDLSLVDLNDAPELVLKKTQAIGEDLLEIYEPKR